MLAGVGQDLPQAVARGDRGRERDIEPACQDLRSGGLDASDESLPDLLEMAAQPGEVAGLILLA